jgi:hypothetical protein
MTLPMALLGVVRSCRELSGKVIPEVILRTLLSISNRRSEDMVLARRKGISLDRIGITI